MKIKASDRREFFCWAFKWSKQKEFAKRNPDYKIFRWLPKFTYYKCNAIPCAWEGGPYEDEYTIECLWLYTGFAIRYGEK